MTSLPIWRSFCILVFIIMLSHRGYQQYVCLVIESCYCSANLVKMSSQDRQVKPTFIRYSWHFKLKIIHISNWPHSAHFGYFDNAEILSIGIWPLSVITLQSSPSIKSLEMPTHPTYMYRNIIVTASQQLCIVIS